MKSVERYSRYKTKVYLDPTLEIQATEIVNQLGSGLILEGAINIGNGIQRIHFRSNDSPVIEYKNFPIFPGNFVYGIVPLDTKTTKELKENIEPKPPSKNARYFKFV